MTKLNQLVLMSKSLFRQYIVLILSVAFCHPVAAESLREYHQRKCDAGYSDSCKRAEAMMAGEQHADRIDQLGDEFAKDVDRSVLEENNKPKLQEAYLIVINHYFEAESEKGMQREIRDDMIELCAEHFHQHWRDRKLWWPTDDEGKPDWSTTYYYIVEHYYGYCLRTFQ